MKFVLIVSLLIFAACGKPSSPSAAEKKNEQIKEKNKLTAAKNEAVEIVKRAQTLEQNGRDLQPYRDSYGGAESAKQCQSIADARGAEITDLETRVNKLPETYKTKLSPVVGELRECVSCAKKGLEDCKKARASINELIKEMF